MGACTQAPENESAIAGDGGSIHQGRHPPLQPSAGQGRRRFHARTGGRGETESAQGRINPPPPLRRGVGAPPRRRGGRGPAKPRASETPGQAPAARLTGRAPSSQPPRLHASLRPSYADAPATRAMTVPCVRGADTTREPTWRSGLRVGRVARANVTRPVKESATTTCATTAGPCARTAVKYYAAVAWNGTTTTAIAPHAWRTSVNTPNTAANVWNA